MINLRILRYLSVWDLVTHSSVVATYYQVFCLLPVNNWPIKIGSAETQLMFDQLLKNNFNFLNTCQPRRSNFWNLGNKITGFASEVNEGGLCLCSHPWKNPPNIQLEVKPQLYWDKLRCLDFTLREQARSSNVILTLGKELKRNKSTSTIWYQLENSASAHIM